MASERSRHPRRSRSRIRKTKPNPPNGNPAHWLLRTSWKEQTQTRATPMPSTIYTRNPGASRREATRLLLCPAIKSRAARAQLEPAGHPMASERSTHPRRPRSRFRKAKPNSPQGIRPPSPSVPRIQSKPKLPQSPVPSSTYAPPSFPLHAFNPRRVNIYVTPLGMGECLP
jgi:hypothetical protein